MSSFIDGPAAGARLQLRRAPFMLRVVQNKQGQWDALDQPTDEAAPDEKIFVYRLIEKPTSYHLLVRGKNRGAGGWYMDGTYRLLVPQPNEIDVRLKAMWDGWCERNREHLVPTWAKEWLSND